MLEAYPGATRSAQSEDQFEGLGIGGLQGPSDATEVTTTPSGRV